MKSFRDTDGREWLISIHVAAVKHVRASAGVDLYGLVDGTFEGLSKLLGDPCQLVDVLFVLCADQAGKRGVSDEDFGRAMAGDVLGSAADAFLAELTDFFPDPRARAALARVIEAGRKVKDRVMDRLDAALDGIDPDAEASRLTGSSGRSPAPSASTRRRSRSAS